MHLVFCLLENILFQIKVMNKQLLLFHNAISAYFSGNQKALDATLKQFAIKFQTPATTGE